MHYWTIMCQWHVNRIYIYIYNIVAYRINKIETLGSSYRTRCFVITIENQWSRQTHRPREIADQQVDSLWYAHRSSRGHRTARYIRLKWTERIVAQMKFRARDFHRTLFLFLFFSPIFSSFFLLASFISPRRQTTSAAAESISGRQGLADITPVNI